MKFAYADPPYVGQAKRHYGRGGREVNYPLLLAHLDTFDGWALSLSSVSLRTLLPLCPADVRVMAWVKPWFAFKGRLPGYAWEPIIARGGRLNRSAKGASERGTLHDWVACSITNSRSVHGAKPMGFCFWLFRTVGLTPSDELFPGSGAVGDAWRSYRRQYSLFDSLLGDETSNAH